MASPLVTPGARREMAMTRFAEARDWRVRNFQASPRRAAGSRPCGEADPGLIAILPLAGRPDLIPLLAGWFEAEWPEYYATQPPGAAAATFVASDHCWFLALNAGTPLGVVNLRPYAIESAPEFSPGLGGLYVLPSARRQGLGGRLIEAVSIEARARDCERLFAATATAAPLFRRLGWRERDTVVHDGEPLTILQFDLI